MGESDPFQMALWKSIPDGAGRGVDWMTRWLLPELWDLEIEYKSSFLEMQKLVASLEEKTR